MNAADALLVIPSLPDALIVVRTVDGDVERIEVSTWQPPIEPIRVCTCNPVFSWFRGLFS